MATAARPGTEIVRRPNVAEANLQLPGVRDYEQVDNEIVGTLRPTAGWFGALGVAILLFLWGAGAWTYQIYWGLGNAGYAPPVLWGVYSITVVLWVGVGHAGTLVSARL
jgi:molybdopterin-containing oxidoreductase family membrane subunit